MKYIIITGASRGLGRALASNLSNQNTKLFLIDKRELKTTIKLCIQKDAKTVFFNFDLANKVDRIPILMSNIFKKINLEDAKSILLINNAAEVTPLGRLGTLKTPKLNYEVKADFTSCVAMTNTFIRKVQSLNIEKKILNISSGAATKPITGAATYCACKAALDMFIKVVAKEQDKKKFPVKIGGVTPGVVDTQMQVDLRTPTKEIFPSVNHFKALKTAGLLQSPQKTAENIIKTFENQKFPHGKTLSYYKFRF